MTTVMFSESAEKVLTAMREQVAAAYHVWGEHPDTFQLDKSETAIKMALSLAQQLAMLPNWGNAEVNRDGDLSLTVSTPHIFFGLIFHRKDRPDMPQEGDMALAYAPMLGRYCFGDKQDGMRGTVRCGAPIMRGEPTCAGHAVEIMTAPVMGDWSFHS